METDKEIATIEEVMNELKPIRDKFPGYLFLVVPREISLEQFLRVGIKK